MPKELLIAANIYTVIWQHNEEHGNYRDRHRVVALSAEDAITLTRPHKMYKAKLIRAETLAEGIEIQTTKELIRAGWGSGNLPYLDKEVRELLETEDEESED